MPKIVSKKLSNKVYLVLKDMIANYRFKPGSRLNVEQLTKELGVSRTPVWEAVSRLEQEGLLETIPNRGVFMTVLTPQKSLQLYQVREVLESMAGGLAAIKIKGVTSGYSKMWRIWAMNIYAPLTSFYVPYSAFSTPVSPRTARFPAFPRQVPVPARFGQTV